MIYLASPYSHEDGKVMEQRAEQAMLAAARFIEQGYHVYSPIVHCHTMSQRYLMPTDYSFWKNFDWDMISLAEEVWVLTIEGWTESEGVLNEIGFAKSLHIPVSFVALKEFYG